MSAGCFDAGRTDPHHELTPRELHELLRGYQLTPQGRVIARTLAREIDRLRAECGLSRITALRILLEDAAAEARRA
jgi:hypothetical protein